MTYEIGMPAHNPAYGNTGYICDIEDISNRKIFVIGSGSMDKQAVNLTIVWEDTQSISVVSDSIADLWIERANAMNLPCVDDAQERLRQAYEERARVVEQNRIEREKADSERNAFKAVAESKMPLWAKSVVYAEYMRDESDSMSDYWGSRTEKTIILAWSKHTRDLFPEMRKAALNHDDTAFLASAPESAEHREKYSMGGGYYLKDGSRHADGWRIVKRSISDAAGVPVGEWALPTETPKTATPVQTNSIASIEEHTHTKKGFQMWIVILADRVERETYLALLDDAKSIGGWYSRKWGKTPAGFAFKSLDNAQEFNSKLGASEEKPDSNASIPNSNPALSDKFRTLADKMQDSIDHKLGDRLTNTPKRQREAASARHEGDRLKRTQCAMRAMADHLDTGTLPQCLCMIKSKKQVYELMGSIIDRTNAGYYDAGIDTGKPYSTTPDALALWAMLKPKSEEEAKAEKLRDDVEQLQFSKIAGYFPTPTGVIDQMLDHAGINYNDSCDILEPSAGSGAICDRTKELYPNAWVRAIEINTKLRNILRDKEINLIGSDFTLSEPDRGYDYVLMNPPFEKGQDAQHIEHAYSFLIPGGRLVAIMSPGPFFRQDKKSTEFREWFESVNGEKYDLPENSFKQSGTGVATVLVVIDREV